MSQATLGNAPYRNSDLFSRYYLDERVDDLDAWNCNDDAREALEELQRLWDLEGELVASYKEDELLDSWIDEVLDVLGFSTLSETTLPDSEGYNDRLLFESSETRRDASTRKRDGDQKAMYNLASAVLEAKQWDADFTKRFAETRSYRDASHQIKYYLEHTPERLQWGILTDGKTWRLYGTKDYATETYYEVNLPELLESGDLEAFKYFFCFFRPAAFREVSGASFLETVWNESETAAQELGEDLQDNVFTALRILGEGFIETNDLNIDPDDEAARDELKEQSLVLLYRLMFVLYAESRHLISPDDSNRAAEFAENFSLDELRQKIHEDISSGDSFDEYSKHSTSMWGRLRDLFRLIDAGEESLGVPPYNGGLFDDETHTFLTTNKVADRYIAEVVYRLGTTRADDGDGYVLADYADLDTRHLGTIYEGLLEHEFRIAPEQYAAVSEDGGQVWKPATEVSVADAVETVERGELYVVNDEGERKATGAYYTPDYVVAYIVEETIDPLINEIKADIAEEEELEPGDKGYIAPFLEQVRNLTVLDPAMGSGHFLTKATGYLTEQVMEVIREQEIQSYDEQEIRRIIARDCIYGVDINGMAVELAKLSMWLETLATDQPLAFLDHHLKAGNSLVGSDITEVLSDDVEEDGQLTLQQALARVRRDTLEYVMELMSELLAIDNETLADIKSMEDTYDEIRSDPLYGRLFEMANVHTAERFGLDVPEGVYEEMAGAIEDDGEWAEVQGRDWFRSAQATAEEENFFHWELEYPEVFFGSDGEKRVDGGFDAVVGNPPYIRVQNLRQSNPKLVDYLNNGGEYTTSKGRYDIYSPFVERGSTLANDGRTGYILPNKFIESGAGKPLREYLLRRNLLNQIIDFGELQIFSGVTTYTCILLLNRSDEEFAYVDVDNRPEEANDIRRSPSTLLSADDLSGKPWVLTDPKIQSILTHIEQVGQDMNGISEQILQGMKSGDNDVLFVELLNNGSPMTIRSPANGERYELESDLVEPIILGKHIHRYEPPETNLAVIYPYEDQEGSTEIIPEQRLKRNYPQTYNYLSAFKQRLTERQSEHMNYETWYALNRPRNKLFFENHKVIVPDICEQSEFTIDNSGEYYIGNTGYGVVPENNVKLVRHYLLAVLNSSTTWFYIYHTSTVLENDFRRFLASYLGPLPIPDSNPEENSKASKLAELGAKQSQHHREISKLNLSLLDHLSTYKGGSTLANIGFTQPPKNAADSILQETTEQKPNLRVGRAEVVRESETTVKICLTARYKPDDEDTHETDQWDYTETDALPALRVTDLTQTEADLIEAFVPVAVDEAGGFANFRETATKTNSLVDRLRKLTLPAVDDVHDGLESYIETKERAEELETKIERTDDLIDKIVYELYGLTEEEIEIVEEAVEA